MQPIKIEMITIYEVGLCTADIETKVDDSTKQNANLDYWLEVAKFYLFFDSSIFSLKMCLAREPREIRGRLRHCEKLLKFKSDCFAKHTRQTVNVVLLRIREG